MSEHVIMTESDLQPEEVAYLLMISHQLGHFLRHDIRGPARLIKGFALLLKEHPEKLSDYIDRMISSAEHLEGLVEHYVQSYVCPDYGQYWLVRPADVIENIRSESQIQVFAGSECDCSLEVLFPRSIFDSVIKELVRNAIKHNGPDTRVLINWRINGKHLDCEVHDSGDGIVPDLGAKRPLDNSIICRASGLHIVRTLVFAAKGALLIERSEKLGGTCFSFSLWVPRHFSKSGIPNVSAS